MRNLLGIDMAALVAAGLVKFPEASGGTGMLKTPKPEFVPYKERKDRHVCRECCRPTMQKRGGGYNLICEDCTRLEKGLAKIRYERSRREI